MVFDAMVDSNGVPCVLMKRMYLSKYHLHDANLSDRAEAILLTKVPFIGEKIAEHINRRFHRVATSTP
ncbi:TPA: hypothetical protein N0F65_008251 [Lagenidium giganteum]|uniref:Uncharacterized protein n=1 Tax=Lagenidium giganteum TaxID=4803 RepID=A0AAV2YM36_9STRA|nr:TPA: hypothetical protein N0F65_008251 [Lagenidium giganteum]